MRKLTNQNLAENTQLFIPNLVDNFIDYRIKVEMNQHDAFLSQYLTPLENEDDNNGFRSKNPDPLRRELSLKKSTFTSRKEVVLVDLTPEEEDFLFDQLKLTVAKHF